ETSAEALAEKAQAVMDEQSARLVQLGMTWGDVTAVTIYCAYPLHAFLERRVLDRVGPAATHGVHWFLSHPPIRELAYEMDVRGVRRELRLGR
ncbi:MAG TPA: hypothetical protein VLA62_07440, partial [Solirubrobacterales bacterium]|nr:hypothetical protein [Solirubrobacterales bacterium]